MKLFAPKLFSSFKGYTAAKLGSDLVAGVIVAIIALPLSIALAIASGVSPQQGLYTAIVAGFVISMLGGSRVQIAGGRHCQHGQCAQRRLAGQEPQCDQGREG